MGAPIEELIDQQQWEKLQKQIEAQPAPEVADALVTLPQDRQALFFNVLSPSQSAEVFSYLMPEVQEPLLKALPDDKVRVLLAKLPPDDRTKVLEGLSHHTISKLLTLLNHQDLQEAQQLLHYPKESVGRLMTPDFVSVMPDWTIGSAFDHIRKEGKESETIAVIYVRDTHWKLLDALNLEQLVLASPSQTISKIMDSSCVALHPEDDQEKAVRTIQKHDLVALPVIDASGNLLGIVTADDVLDVAEEEATEDMQKGAAVEPLKTRYRDSSVWGLYRKRIPWLGGLVLVNLVASGVIAFYEETLASALALAFFIPVLMGSGGNTGTQAATLMVRALATENFTGAQWMKTLLKEIGVGSLLGITMGLGIAVLGIARNDWALGMTVGLAMGAIVLLSNIIGVLFPIVLNYFRVDPAVASSPMVTSTADVTSLALYFAIATFVLTNAPGGM
ncbi:magnesium transporter [Candidatus Nitronereus thalassa]|uniref:Magnesium transporter MgtE n=1 Tax=Candidatus Nitronereus thalassa TaxID=3020898 RepID=A0ABU3KBZ5_9BACT|nr:magnesium transporter [Candidatus Nitronereus thalassa]MDT7043749.1 magnesium transporter [Candidatus Nitronereus thalassa]